jgi:hypothetical protein
MPSAGLLPISLDGLPPPPSSAVAGGVVDGEETRWDGGGEIKRLRWVDTTMDDDQSPEGIDWR